MGLRRNDDDASPMLRLHMHTSHNGCEQDETRCNSPSRRGFADLLWAFFDLRLSCDTHTGSLHGDSPTCSKILSFRRQLAVCFASQDTQFALGGTVELWFRHAMGLVIVLTVHTNATASGTTASRLLLPRASPLRLHHHTTSAFIISLVTINRDRRDQRSHTQCTLTSFQTIVSPSTYAVSLDFGSPHPETHDRATAITTVAAESYFFPIGGLDLTSHKPQTDVSPHGGGGAAFSRDSDAAYACYHDTGN